MSARHMRRAARGGRGDLTNGGRGKYVCKAHAAVQPVGEWVISPLGERKGVPRRRVQGSVGAEGTEQVRHQARRWQRCMADTEVYG